MSDAPFVSPDPRSSDEPPHNPGPEFSITCFVPRGGAGPVFRATGSMQDEGTVEGTPLPVGEGRAAWVGYRMLKGRKGALFLVVEAGFVKRGTTVARGTFDIADGTGVYDGLHGGGDFRAAIDAEGRPTEAFSGRLAGA